MSVHWYANPFFLKERQKIRQDTHDLAQTIQATEGLVQEFVSTRIFGRLFNYSEAEISNFWIQKVSIN